MIPEVETEIARGTKRLQKILDVKLATYFIKRLEEFFEEPGLSKTVKVYKRFSSDSSIQFLMDLDPEV